MSRWIVAADGTQKQGNKSDFNLLILQIDFWPRKRMLSKLTGGSPTYCNIPMIIAHRTQHVGRYTSLSTVWKFEAQNKSSCLLTQDLFLSVSLATVQLNRSFTCWSPWQCSTPPFSCITHKLLERVQGRLQSTLLSSLRLPSALRNILMPSTLTIDLTALSR